MSYAIGRAEVSVRCLALGEAGHAKALQASGSPGIVDVA
jgi:hypothetical protein